MQLASDRSGRDLCQDSSAGSMSSVGDSHDDGRSMIAYTQCYNGLSRLPNIRAVVPIGGISLLYREMKLLLRAIFPKPGALLIM